MLMLCLFYFQTSAGVNNQGTQTEKVIIVTNRSTVSASFDLCDDGDLMAAVSATVKVL